MKRGDAPVPGQPDKTQQTRPERFFFVVSDEILRPGSRVQLFKYLKNLKKTTSNDDIFLVEYLQVC